MPTPLDYANQYRALTIAFDDGPVTVRIERYHIGAWTKAADHVIDVATSDFRDRKKKDPTYVLTLTVSGTPVTIKDESVLRRILHYAFEGKGSPEDCQVAAQVAVLQGIVKKKTDLPAFCQANIGLDCNGFVGNYLWYARTGNKWPDVQPRDNQGPNALIDDLILKGGTVPVSGLDALQPAALNIFGLLDAQFRVVPKDTKTAHAHIVISEPGRFTTNSFVTNSFGGLDTRSGIWGHKGLWCVESTGPQNAIGLRDTWYALTEVRDKKNKLQSVHSNPTYKVFRVYRGSKQEWLNFTIASLPLQA
jgi:hypothetical protein